MDWKLIKFSNSRVCPLLQLYLSWGFLWTIHWSSFSTPSVPTPPAVKCHVFISVNYRARLDEWNDPSGACASCTLWLLILLPLLPGDSDLVELDGGASWFCLGLGARDALFPRAPSEYSLLGESLVGERIFSGFGGGGLSRSENKSRSIIQSVN